MGEAPHLFLLPLFKSSKRRSAFLATLPEFPACFRFARVRLCLDEALRRRLRERAFAFIFCSRDNVAPSQIIKLSVPSHPAILTAAQIPG